MASGLENIETIESPFRRFVTTIGVFPTAFTDAMTYYECLAYLVKYLEDTVIPAVNDNAEALAELQSLFVELKSYVDNYFANLDVQEEINKKLDDLANSGELGELMARYIDPQFTELEETVNSSIDTMMNLVQATTSATPTPVSSTADMTDHDKTYLLTTDGYWYYWNGTVWTQGGVYQATVIPNQSVTPNKVTFSKRSANLIDVASVNNINCIIDSDGGIYKLITNANCTSLYVPITAGHTYTFIRQNKSANRFVIGFTAELPANGVQVVSRYSFPSATMDHTLTAPEGTSYAVIYYQNGAVTNPYVLGELPEYICIKEGTDTNFVTSYVLDIKGSDIADGSIGADKLDSNLTANSANLFDYTNANIGNLSVENGVLAANNVKRSISIPCEPDTKYTILKRQSARFQVSTTNVQPASGVPALQNRNNNSGTKITITTASNANFLNVFYYNSNSDTQNPNTILQSICITVGDNDTFIPYGKVLSVGTENYKDDSITMEKLSSSVKESLIGMTPIQSRSNIYGVKFDLTSTSTAGVRIADAEGLHNDYIVDVNYQLNGGNNDFDSIFPWCEMRRCNLKIQNGKKVITYEGETGFALDGSNGDVMVEIPKFYSYRKRVGNYETWAITGEPKSEFIVEPAFIVDGKELDYIYISAYEGCQKTNNSFSISGKTPKIGSSKAEYISTYATTGMQSYDITTFMLLQKLMVIEFADRNLQNYLGGVTYLPYGFYGDTEDTITAIGANTVTVPLDTRKSALWIGERIKFLAEDTGSDETYARYITNLSFGSNDVTITYSGSDLSGTIKVGDAFSGCPQQTGLTDDLTYHTGRTNYSAGNTYENYVNPFRYRYIENVYGNVWKDIAGIRVMNLDYYINYEPNYDVSITNPTADYYIPSYKAPLQDQYGEGGAGYIVACGYDTNDHNIMLPILCGTSNGGGYNKYFADAFYSKNESATTEYEACVGGGWDHFQMSGVFCLRCWNNIGIHNGLIGNRVIYRG